MLQNRQVKFAVSPRRDIDRPFGHVNYNALENHPSCANEVYNRAIPWLLVASELERYLYLCRDILVKNRDFVLALADELYKKETLLYSDVQRIRARYSITPCLEYSEPEGTAKISDAEPGSEENVGSVEG